MKKIMAILVIISGISFAKSSDKILHCYSYGDSENGVEVSIMKSEKQFSAKFIEIIIGGRITSDIGELSYKNSEENSFEVYNLKGDSKYFSVFKLRVWPDDIQEMVVGWPQTKKIKGFFAILDLQFHGGTAPTPGNFVCQE